MLLNLRINLYMAFVYCFITPGFVYFGWPKFSVIRKSIKWFGRNVKTLVRIYATSDMTMNEYREEVTKMLQWYLYILKTVEESA